MQAPGSLSPEQKHSLESTYTFIRGFGVFLEAVQPALTGEDRLNAQNLRALAALCEHKLIESFPELHIWLAEWTRGGGQ